MILIVHLLTWHEFTALCGGTCNKVFNKDNKVLGRSLRACCRLISLADREFTTGSNCSGKQRYGVILKLQLSKRASLTNQKTHRSFVPVVSYGHLPFSHNNCSFLPPINRIIKIWRWRWQRELLKTYRLRLAKQRLSCTFLCRHCASTAVKMPNFTFSCKQVTAKFSFCCWTWIWLGKFAYIDMTSCTCQFCEMFIVCARICANNASCAG